MKSLKHTIRADSYRVADGSPVERHNIARDPRVRVDVGVPFGQAAMGGILISSLVVSIAIVVIRLSNGDAWVMIPDLGLLWVVVFLATTTGLYFMRLDFIQRTIWNVEKLTSWDLTKDNVVGRPDQHWIDSNLPGPQPGVVRPRALDKQQRLEMFVHKCYDLHDTTFRGVAATLQGLEPGDYIEFRNLLIQSGLANWVSRGKSHGWQFTLGSAGETIKALAKKGMYSIQ